MPGEAAAHSFAADELPAPADFRAQQARGAPETVAKHPANLVDATGADELMMVTHTRLRTGRPPEVLRTLVMALSET
ncbi:hypothetical protein [Streptomyces sp. 142MFCol3.1]|uniref:hypothetical protein n=1 Tax=Streptomyces sp. 142MFCol3.1 TaxID=1172179 RepID=UPI00041C8AA8|nr:hypothetical protein [Streptomyces sp. 142MFCol3.1]